MTSENSEECATDTPLAPAGILTRIGKFVAGTLQLLVIYILITNPELAQSSEPWSGPGLWVAAGLALLLLVWSVDLGFKGQWGRRVLGGVLVLLVAGAAYGLATSGSLWSVPVSLILYATTFYVHGHMGICHVIAAIMGTPGCEMRVLPAIWAKMTGRGVEFCACPGFWTPLDNWEHRVRTRSQGDTNSAA